MSFAKKLLFGFLGMMAIATFIGVRGLYAVNELNGKIAETIEYEMQAADYFAEFGVTFKAIDSVQRTLLNSNPAMDEREKQYAEYDANVKILDGIMENLKNILEKGSSTVDGWDNVLAEWRKTNSVLRKWEENNAILIKMHREWEKTTILNPDDLLRRLQQYRADHYGLVARLGGMLADGKSSGLDISTDDTLCNFGKARVNFENGSVPYCFNPVLMKAMRMIGGPHKEFHQTAHNLQELIKGGYDRNQAAIIAMFGKLIDLANQVIAEFDTMAAEAERSRELYEALYQKATMEFLPVQTDAMTKLIAVVDLNSKNAKENSDRAVADGENASKIMTWLVGASIVFGAILVLLLQRTVRHGVAMPLDRAVKGLFASASEVAAAAVDLSQTSVSLSDGAQNQAASLEEISAALEEISSMTRKNADSTNEADSLMSDTASLITEGAREMGRMSTAMGEIRDSSNKINQILGVIEGIAFQTNLLALNAAVEAARAGEAGKGFAVVADEVRNLAQRSAQAAKDTATLITGTVDRVQNGVTITNDIGERFTKIKESTEKIVRMLGEIKTATNEQALGIDQVNTSVAQIDKVTQDNTANAEKSASESHRLSESSDHTMQTVGELSDTLDAIMGRKPGSSRAEASRHTARPARKKGGGRALPIASISRPTVMRPEDIVPLDECDDF